MLSRLVMRPGVQCEGEIFKFTLATMLSCNDVIDQAGRRMKS